MTGSTDRTVAVLSALAEADGPLSVSELAERVGVGPSTAHRFLMLLRAHGLVEQDPATRRYGIGREFVRLSALVLGRDRLGHLARPQLQALVAETGHAALLAVRLDVADISFVERSDPLSPLRFRHALHRRVPAVRSVAGWAMLSLASPEEVLAATERDRIERPDLEPVDASGLLSELERCRARGWAIWRSQRSGAVGVAAPVLGLQGASVAALTVFAPLVDVGISSERSLGETVAGHARQFSQLIAGQR